MNIQEKVLQWIAIGRVGASSKSMALCAAGIQEAGSFRPAYPHDPADLNRCLLMIEIVPEVRLEFHKIAKLSDVWARLISNWSTLEETFLDEVGRDWCEAKSAPFTYKLMREIIDDYTDHNEQEQP